MKPVKSHNINSIWSTLIVEELLRNGVDYFCISSGSRSSPLTTAVATHKKAKSFIHFDERASAFHALGYTSATKQPSVIITTSGTAVANVFPAIVEASKKKIPLIVITADRPPELRLTGANQTIDQVKIFGNYVRWQVDLPCPTIKIQPEFVLTTIDQALFQAQHNPAGPIHINCMFREPLAPIADNTNTKVYLKSIEHWQKVKHSYTQYVKGESQLNKQSIAEIKKRLSAIKSGLMVVGKLSSDDERQSVLQLAEKLNWPIFPDISSGLRLGNPHPKLIHYFDQILVSNKMLKQLHIDGVLHIGGRITSKRWYDFIEQSKPKEYITVLNHPLRNDPLHAVTYRVHSSVKNFCQLFKNGSKIKPSPLLQTLQNFNGKVHDLLNAFFEKKNSQLSEAMSARLITQNIRKDHALFLASSLPVREVDAFGSSHEGCATIGSNRGASGIDGTIATAAGFSIGLNKRTTVVLGDLAFLYDLNALAMITHLKQPMVILVFNNNGGGIFSFLPIAQFDSIFEKYFATPHDLNFKSVSIMFGLNYAQPKTKDAFVGVYNKALKNKKINSD